MKKKPIEITYHFFPNPFVFGENPLNSNSAFCDLFREGPWQKYALIINCCVRLGHIVDQYFFDNTVKLAKVVVKQKEEKEFNYDSFLASVYKHGLSNFGRLSLGNSYSGGPIDHNFWHRVYDYIQGETSFHCKVEGSSDNLM